MSELDKAWIMLLVCGAGLIKRLHMLAQHVNDTNIAYAVALALLVVYFAVQIKRNNKTNEQEIKALPLHGLRRI